MNKNQRINEKRAVNDVRLTYTDKMKEQDLLYDAEKEDRELMVKLHESILNEARTLGWTGYAITYTYDNPDAPETMTELYKSERDWKDGNEPHEILAPCRLLIKELENLLNEQRKKEIDSMLIAECLQNHRNITIDKDGKEIQVRCDLYADGSFYEIKNRIPDFSCGVSLREIKSSR